MTTAPTCSAWASDVRYIEDELEWVAARAQRIVLERRRDVAPEERPTRRGGFVLDDDKIEPHVLAARIDGALSHEKELRAAIDERLVVHRRGGTFELGLDRLVRANALDAFDRVVLILAAGPPVSKRFERLYAALENDKNPALTVDVVFAFLGLSAADRIERRKSLGPRGRLVASDLIEMNFGGRAPMPKDLLSTEVELRGRTFALMLGDTGLGDELADLVRLERPRATMERVVLPEIDKERILAVIDGHDRVLAARAAWGLDDAITYGRGVIILFDGPPGTGKTMTAHAVAHRLGRRVMNVDIPTFLAHEDSGGTFIPGLFREARLQGALLFFDECDALLYSRRLGNPLMSVILTELERFDGIAVLATNVPHVLDDAIDRRVLVRVHFARPQRDARAAIWRALLPPTVPLAEDVDIDRLSEFELSGGSVKNAILAAAATAVYRVADVTTAKVTHAMLETAARDQSEGRRLTRADFDRIDREEEAAPTPGRRRPAGFR